MEHRKILHSKYRKMRKGIEGRLSHFETVGQSSAQTLFEELAFCILTPQSKAFSCDEAIRELRRSGLLWNGNVEEVRAVLAKKTRFHNKKAVFLLLAREKFYKDGFASLHALTFSGSEHEAREALLKEVKGIGWKEASHYLRNVGRGREIAILDRHILKNLVKHRAIGRLPKSLTQKRYLEIEKKMENFCREEGIPMAHLDLLFWAEETGKIFK